MNESQIRVRYAKALFQSAAEQKQLDRVYQDMEILAETCELGDFHNMLMNPTLQPSQKNAIILEVLGKHVGELTVALIGLVVKNKRGLYLPGIARNFKDLYRKEKGIMNATLLSAKAVDKAGMDGIKRLIAEAYDAKIELQAHIDEGIIGGFVLSVEDQRYDASVSSGLRKIQKKLLQTSIENK